MSVECVKWESSRPTGSCAQVGLSWPRLPDRVPDLERPWLGLFGLLWYPALLLAIVGPLIGTWHRLIQPSANSALMVGSRAGLVLNEDDLTKVRFAVGAAARNAGIQPGDDITAINGIAVSRSCRSARAAWPGRTMQRTPTMHCSRR